MLYVGVGAGMEALQLSYLLRRDGGVVAIDKVPEMLETADRLLDLAEQQNPWSNDRAGRSESGCQRQSIRTPSASISTSA